MKALVYTTAFGEEHFFLLAEQMLRSLRASGFAGDVRVVTDRAHAFDPALDASVLTPADAERTTLIKARLHELEDVSSYDAILYVDTDVVFVRDPAPLLALAPGGMRVSRDHCPLSRNAFNLTFFSPEERRMGGLSATRSLNSGVILFPGARYADLAARWVEAWDAPTVRKRTSSLPRKHAELRDQPVLQRLITLDGLDCGYIPDDLILMPLFFTENASLGPDTVLLHLNGSARTPQRKKELIRIMSELTAAESHEARLAICGRLRASRRNCSFEPLPSNPEPTETVP